MQGKNSMTGAARAGDFCTIVLPVYNEAGILRENVHEILAHVRALPERYRFEVLIVNDGSRDDSGAIADALARENPEVRVVHHPTNFGLGQALRYGFAAARGDYIVVLDVDLSYSPDHIERLLDRIVETRAKLVLASPYMKGGQLTNVPWLRKTLSIWGNRFLRLFARGGVSTLTCMVRAYDAHFVRSLALRSTGMDLMPEAIYKTMILRGRIEQVPAHLDWSKQVAAGVRRSSSMRILRHVFSTIFSGFFFRPFMFLVVPGLILLVFACYVSAWMFIHFFEAYLSLPAATRTPSGAVAIAYAAYPHTFVVALLSLMLSVQVIGLGILAVQAQKYFEELFFQGTRVQRRLEGVPHAGSDRPAE